MAVAARKVTVQLPDSVYEQIEQRALEAHRSVEAEIAVAVAAAVAPPRLSSDLLEAVEGLAVLDDEALWRAARLRIPEEVSTRVEDLNWKRQSTGLLEAREDEELARSLQIYERTMLVRAQAAKLLHERDHDVASVLLGE